MSRRRNVRSWAKSVLKNTESLHKKVPMAVRHGQTPMAQRDWAHQTRYTRSQYRLIVIRALEPVLASRRDNVTRTVREIVHQEMQGIAHAKTAFLEGRLPERFYTGVRGGAFAVIDHALRKIGGEASVALFHAELADASNMVFQKTFWNPALPAGFESKHHIAPSEPEELEADYRRWEAGTHFLQKANRPKKPNRTVYGIDYNKPVDPREN